MVAPQHIAHGGSRADTPGPAPAGTPDDGHAGLGEVGHEMSAELPPVDLTGAHAPRSAQPVPVQSRRVRLEVPGERHLLSLWELAADPATSFRWRYHGRVPSPQEFADTVWDGVATQFVAHDLATDEPVAWLLGYNYNPRDQHLFVAVHGWPTNLGSVTLLDGVFVFLRYVFGNFALRKVYAEVREFNLTQFASGAGRFFEVEGRLRAHAFYDGIWWDQLILSLTREQFADVEARYGVRWFGLDPTRPAPTQPAPARPGTSRSTEPVPADPAARPAAPRAAPTEVRP